MRTAYITYDDLDGLGLDITGLINSAVNTYSTVQGVKDAGRIAVATANANRAAANAEAERQRTLAAMATASKEGAGIDWNKAALYGAGALALAGVVIALKRRRSRRR